NVHFYVACGRFARRSRSLTSQTRSSGRTRPPSLGGLKWREGNLEARQCSNLDGRGRPSSIEFFLMADRSAEQRAELRSAGQPTAAVPTWFFFQIGMRAVRVSVPHGECPPGRSCRLKP